MLYQLHEMQRSFLNPLMQWADASAKLFSNPVSPFAHTPFSQRIAAGYELMYRLGKDYEKPAFGLTSTTINGQDVGIMERTVLSKPFCKLQHFKKDMSDTEFAALKQPVVLVVAPLSGHHATLLRDTVRALLPDQDVYVTDWVDARMVPLSDGPFHLDDYIYYVQDFIRHLGPDVHVISVCQPTVPVLAAISLMASNKDDKLPKSMIMMGGPIDPRKSPTAVNDLAIDRGRVQIEARLFVILAQAVHQFIAGGDTLGERGVGEWRDGVREQFGRGVGPLHQRVQEGALHLVQLVKHIISFTLLCLYERFVRQINQL